MDKRVVKTILMLLLACCVLIASPLLFITDSQFQGADGKSVALIYEINPYYTQWVESAIAPPGTETESLLFSLQAAAGASVIAFGFGYYLAKGR